MGKVMHGPWTEQQKRANGQIARWNQKRRWPPKVVDSDVEVAVDSAAPVHKRSP